ncbi:MAG: methyltransferase domain-containing protein [Desulfovibrionales bacterium]
MRDDLLDILICPSCLPQERKLALGRAQVLQGDINDGLLHCSRCDRSYPIRDGVAVLLADGEGAEAIDRYGHPEVVSRYVWSQFCDLVQEGRGASAYGTWSARLEATGGKGLDAGCGIGRMTLEMGRRMDLAVGIDRSVPFVHAARRLAREGTLEFELLLEGEIVEQRRVKLPNTLRALPVEYLVADVQALPFPRSLFSQLVSLNIVDKIADPLGHLRELDRVAGRRDASLLFADPFSWSEEIAPRDRWLGGTRAGRFAGPARRNVEQLLRGREGLLSPWEPGPWQEVEWTIRIHANLTERISSQTLVARRPK